MNCVFAPSILSFDPANYAVTVTELMGCGADRIHLDVMDGQFVPPITFGADLARSLARLGKTPLEAHLMVQTPERHFDAFVDAGCRRIVFHAEATAHAHRLAQSLVERSVEVGIAINPGTPVEMVEPLFDIVDQILVMTVNPGWGGQTLIPATLDKVRRIRAARPNLDIEVDGGIDLVTLPEARAAGANVFVVGSWLTKQASIQQGLKDLRSACD